MIKTTAGCQHYALRSCSVTGSFQKLTFLSDSAAEKKKKRSATFHIFSVWYSILQSVMFNAFQKLFCYKSCYPPIVATQRCGIKLLHIERRQLRWCEHLLRMHHEDQDYQFHNMLFLLLLLLNMQTYSSRLKPRVVVH